MAKRRTGSGPGPRAARANGAAAPGPSATRPNGADSHSAAPHSAAPRAATPPTTPRPTPGRLAGTTDPARRVRPVDWTATGAAPAASDEAASGGADAAETRQDRRPAEGPGDRLPRRRPRTLELPRPLPAPPAAALHTLGPDDERDAPRPLRIEEAAIRLVGNGIDDLARDDLVEAVADPEDAWTSDNGVSDHFLRGRLVVQVRRADNLVIGAFARGYALAVRPEGARTLDDLAERAAGAAGRSVRRGPGTRVPTTRRELLDRLEREGFVVTPGSGHGRVTHPEHPGLFVPMASTPSDVRFTRYAVSQIRRVFGVDLRD